VLVHLPVVKAIAVRVHANLPVDVDLDDPVHPGILGLFDAAGKFNPNEQVIFSSYAKHRIKGAILDSLRKLNWASRDMRRGYKQVEATTRDLATELHRNPTDEEWPRLTTRRQNAGRQTAVAGTGRHSSSTRSPGRIGKTRRSRQASILHRS